MTDRPRPRHDLETLLDEVRLLFCRAAQAIGQLHAGGPATVGARAVLEHLQSGGPATVPDLARRRYVSRQHIQVLVNALLAAGLVVQRDNPAHRRSRRIAPTAAGARVIARIKQREARFIADLRLPAGGRELARACRVLRTVRAALDVAPALAPRRARAPRATPS